MSIEYICSRLIKMVKCPIRVYNKNSNLILEYGSINKEMDPIFCDDDFRYKLINEVIDEYPILYSEDGVVKYGAMLLNEEIYIIGPIRTDKITDKIKEDMSKKHNMKKENINISFCENESFVSALLILHNLVYDSNLSYIDVITKNINDKKSLINIEKKITDVVVENLELEVAHNPYSQEVRELDSIRQGDREKLKMSLAETYVGKVGRMAKSEIRQAKNVAICVITLASRAAIEGGVIPELAFTTVDGYILEIEDLNNVDEIENLMRKAEFKFIDLVEESSGSKEKNPIVNKCKEIICKNIHSKIRVEEIALQLNVNKDYLSHLFRKTENITITQYILSEKIRLSENLLRYSNHTIEQIAYYFNFGSQSHFGKVFKEIKGMTPAQYRSKYNSKI